MAGYKIAGGGKRETLIPDYVKPLLHRVSVHGQGSYPRSKVLLSQMDSSTKQNGVNMSIPKSFIDRLLGNGWREYPNVLKPHARCFYQQFNTPSRCNGNSDKPGLQIELAISELNSHTLMELELCAGLKDDTWLRIQNYSLPDDVEKVLKLIPRMLAAWEECNKSKWG